MSSYDYRAIEHLLNELHRWDAHWEDWFHATGREPIRVIYEEFVESRAATVGRVLDALGIDPPEPGRQEAVAAPGGRPLKGLGRLFQGRQRNTLSPSDPRLRKPHSTSSRSSPILLSGSVAPDGGRIPIPPE